MAEEQFSKKTVSGLESQELKIEQPELDRLKERIDKLEGQLEKEKKSESKEAIVKQEIKSHLQEMQQVLPTAAPVSTRDDTDEISKFPSNQQVGALISLVFEKGLSQAVSVARNLDNPAVLDEFHDILVDRYYDELLEKKILKSL